MAKILIIEDDTDINNMIAEYLNERNMEVEQAFSGTEGKLLWQMNPFDLLILDLMLPGMSGEELTAWIRKNSQVPIIVLTAKDALENKIELLGGGADDYLTKPFALEELWMRVQVQLRHVGAVLEQKMISYKEWSIDLTSMCLRVHVEPINLTAHEFAIVELFMRRPKKVFTKQEIYEAVWQQDYVIEDKTIHVHISNIRSKLKKTKTDHYIQTVWGIGFRLIE